TFLIFSGVLLIISLAYFISTKEKKTACIIAVILFILCTVFGRSGSFAFWENNLTYEGESIYNYLQVKENDKEVLLSTNVLFGVQSVTRKDGSLTGGMYYDYDMAAPVMAGVRDKEHSDMLILGMGTGTYARQCKRYFDGLDIEGVEIDGKITDLADRYFDADPGVPVYTYDGRAYLHVSDKKYDVIMVDAYQDISIPFQMSSVEFFREVYEHLNDDGIMVVNMNMRSDSEGNINEYLTDTIASVFPSVYTIDIPHYTNRELFASKNSDCRNRLYENSLNMSDTELTELMLDTYAGLEEKTGMDHIFTDDKAPVELLGMREIDGLIKNEVSYYRNIYDEYGLQGVLDSLGI
ncbi:MAG: fused MFS/spermidine synthase, partial [Lachnospiraceae bacterium]|nr:fused MFS/spermidine synthase [Lachnospiraceae bacterium]